MFQIIREMLHFPLICTDPIMIVIRIRSSGYNEPRISLVQIKLSLCHCYSSLSSQVTSNDKTPTVISSALEKHNQDPKQASRYELIQLLPEGKGKDVLAVAAREHFKRIICSPKINATGNVFLDQYYHLVVYLSHPNRNKTDIILRF